LKRDRAVIVMMMATRSLRCQKRGGVNFHASNERELTFTSLSMLTLGASKICSDIALPADLFVIAINY
jgi:hypothetical protein